MTRRPTISHDFANALPLQLGALALHLPALADLLHRDAAMPALAFISIIELPGMATRALVHSKKATDAPQGRHRSFLYRRFGFSMKKQNEVASVSGKILWSPARMP